MKYADANARLLDYRRQIAAIRERMRETLAAAGSTSPAATVTAALAAGACAGARNI